MNARIVPVLLLLGLAACGQEEPRKAAAPAQAPVPYAGPVFYPEAGELSPNADLFIWAYSGDGGVERLARGLPNGEMLDVLFTCRAEQPAVQFSFYQKGPAPKTVKFSSGDETTEYMTQAGAPDYSHSDAWALSGELQPRDDAFTAFLASGRMTRWYGDKAHAWDARTEADRSAVAKFAEACKAKI